MRAFTDGSGADSTAAWKTYAAAGKLTPANLYLIGEVDDPQAVWLTDYDSDLLWSIYGTFRRSSIKRGNISSQVGLQVDSLEITWSPPLTAFGASIATANPYQKAQLGVYDNWRVRVFRCAMPTPGDANTIGACTAFGGWINDTEIGRGYIKFTAASFLSAINQKVPPNVIESSNAFASYSGAFPSAPDGETNVPTFVVVAPSNTNVFLGQCTGPNPGSIYAKNRFLRGYLQFTSGSLKGFWSPIGANQSYNAGGGVHYNQFQTYAQFPWAPDPGDAFYASVQPAVDFAGAQAAGEAFIGFPFVPSPLAAV
jgi:hypothetical protein